MFEEIRLLQSSSSTFVSSLRLPTSQMCCKLKKTAQSFLKEIVNILINGLKEPVKVSGRTELFCKFVRCATRAISAISENTRDINP